MDVEDTPFTVEIASLDRTLRIIVRGALDAWTAPELSCALMAAIECTDGDVVVDLAELGFIDSSGLDALVRARAALGEQQRTLTIHRPTRRARTVFALSGLDGYLRVDGDADTAPAGRPQLGASQDAVVGASDDDRRRQ